jgi:hypothetical protein
MKRRKPLPSTVPRARPPKREPGDTRRAPRVTLPARPQVSRPVSRPAPQKPPRREVARIVDNDDKSLVDVLDSLLNQGVVLRADVVLALADVDLVYVRLSALLCAADRLLPRRA